MDSAEAVTPQVMPAKRKMQINLPPVQSPAPIYFVQSAPPKRVRKAYRMNLFSQVATALMFLLILAFAGLVFLLESIGFGVLLLLLAFVVAAKGARPHHECLECRTKVHRKALTCPGCRNQFT